MGGELPRVTAKQIIPVVERLGFVCVRQSGSHKIYKNARNKRTTVPYHAGQILHPKILKSILKDADLTIENFKDGL